MYNVQCTYTYSNNWLKPWVLLTKTLRWFSQAWRVDEESVKYYNGMYNVQCTYTYSNNWLKPWVLGASLVNLFLGE